MRLPPTALQPARFVNSDHPDVIAFARSATAGATSEAETVSLLFAAVRDHIRYDPYTLVLRPELMQASHIVAGASNWCVPKATLLVACCRAMGIRSRVGFADVRNHLTSRKLDELMGTDLFKWHGYAAIEVEGRVHKASPAFNADLCERFGVEPLDFDGTADALLHAFDGDGRPYMEYVRDRGLFDDVPYSQMIDELSASYPRLVEAAEAAVDPAFS